MSDTAVQITQTIVAGTVGLVAAATTLVGVLLTRSEPRALKELYALNEVLKKMPEGDVRDQLVRKRDRVSERYASRGQFGPEAVGLIAFGVGASSLLILGALTSFSAGTFPQYWAVLLATLDIVLSLLGLLAIILGAFILVSTSARDVAAWNRERRATREERRAKRGLDESQVPAADVDSNSQPAAGT